MIRAMSKPSCVDGETRKANDGDDDGSDEEEERATYLYHVNSVDLLKKHMLQDTGGVLGGAEGGQRALDALEKEDEGDDEGNDVCSVRFSGTPCDVILPELPWRCVEVEGGKKADDEPNSGDKRNLDEATKAQAEVERSALSPTKKPKIGP